jgi:peroxiredoxin
LVEVGEKPPQFQLPDQDRNLKLLKDFLGKKTVLAFFPGAFTSVCSREMCKFRDSAQPLLDFGAQVAGISVNDPFTNKAFTETNRLPFLILSDYMRDAVKKYDVFHSDFAGFKGYAAAKRSVFILDEAGTLRYKWISEDPGKEPNYEEIMKQLSQLLVKYAKSHFCTFQSLKTEEHVLCPVDFPTSYS